jgi:hypothetical protein
LTLPLDAVDINLYRDRYLLVVMGKNEVCRLDLDMIEASAPPTMESTTFEPAWEGESVAQPLVEQTVT